MPRWTVQDLANYEARHNALGPIIKPIIRHESLGQEARETSHTAGFHVSITSYRRRLLDPDNLCPKYFIDCLRYAEIIPDDNPDCITLETRQVKVKGKNEECTVLEVTKAS